MGADPAPLSLEDLAASQLAPLLPRGCVFATPYWLVGIATVIYAGLVPVGVMPEPDDLRPTSTRGDDLVVTVGAWLSPGPHQLVIAAYDEGHQLEVAFPGVVMVTEPDDPALSEPL